MTPAGIAGPPQMAATFAALQWPLPNEAADRWADRVCAAALKDVGILKPRRALAARDGAPKEEETPHDA